jgi:hypothetical protein
MQMTWRGTDLYWECREVGSIVPDGRYPACGACFQPMDRDFPVAAVGLLL